MISLDNIKECALSKASSWSVFDLVEDFAKLPAQHLQQILFMNREANTYLYLPMLQKLSTDTQLAEAYKQASR